MLAGDNWGYALDKARGSANAGKPDRSNQIDQSRSIKAGRRVSRPIADDDRRRRG
ncbi:hypothetical protein [Lysobacter sp. CA199]|uniref:hypothetical protein n=1 Tax=Lysobacter sp. CA199 TaxID=3455608 RepID=UPI003F8D2394